MSWIEEHISIWRVGVLILLAAAVVSPWTFSNDGLPPPEWCSGADLLVVGDRCVRLVSGAEVFAWFLFVFVEITASLLRQANLLGEVSRIIPLLILEFALLIPFLSTLLIFLRNESRRRRIFHAAMLGLALTSSLLIMVVPRLLPRLPELSGRLWGGWLYAGVAGVAMILEVIVLAKENPSTTN